MRRRARLDRARVALALAVVASPLLAGCDTGTLPPAPSESAAPSKPSAPSESSGPSEASGTATSADDRPAGDDTADLLLAWTLGGLPDGFADGVAGLPDVQETTVVAGGLVDLLASVAVDGTPVDDLESGWAVPTDVIAIDPDAYAAVRASGGEAQKMLAGLEPGHALVEALTSRGFAWGGPWLSPDPMHFEYLGGYAEMLPENDEP